MKISRSILIPLSLFLAIVALRGQVPSTAAQRFSTSLQTLVNIIQPVATTPTNTISTTIEIVTAEGLPSMLAGKRINVLYQAPDRLRLSAEVDEKSYAAGRDRQELWIHVPTKKFGVIGKPEIPRFATNPSSTNSVPLPNFKLPLPREQLALLPLLMNVTDRGLETIDGVECQALEVVPKPEAQAALKLPAGKLELALRTADSLPVRISYVNGKSNRVELRFHHLKLEVAPADTAWQLSPQAGDRIETTAMDHLRRFIPVVIDGLSQKLPPLGPATGTRNVVATEGQGRLEKIDGTRVLFLKGTSEEMGHQHGVLMKKQISEVVDRILYGVGVGSSFDKGRWFFGEIENAQRRLAPFIDPRYLAEMDAIAAATHRDKEEIRLANFFPELFHCSGFALFGDATSGGRMFHGRILDYLSGVGLEQNAVVMVIQPTDRNAWVNISYAGFVGSVTAMNEKHIALGEMGGRGEGNWDGKPMAQLMREVMENADTIDEAVEIMRRGPRTCEYYYVISDAKSHRAVGVAATPTKFELVWAGQSHPELPHPVKDTVLMSAGNRYEKLVERVKQGYGKFDADSARELMCRPVAMKSNIHSVLFAPDTLDFWVANADEQNPASHARYTHYNLGELLKAQ